MNKWATVHELNSPDEQLTAVNSIAKFTRDGDAQLFAERFNTDPFRWLAVKRTYGTVYVIPKPR